MFDLKNKINPIYWIKLLRPGDWLVFSLCAALVVLSIMLFWQSGAPHSAIIRAGGQQVARLSLDQQNHFEVSGPLGITQIEIQPGRARIASDPGPRQYCVKQGWLTRAGAVAICAPNHVTLSLEGARASYDSLNY